MKEELKYNLTNYLITNNKKQKIITVLIVLILLSLFAFLTIYKIDDIEKINTITTCEEKKCTFKFYRTNSKNINYDFAKIKNKKYKISKLKFEEPTLDSNNTLLQEVTLQLKNYQGKNNEIVEIKLYKNKEKIIKKIFNMIVER